MNLSVMAVRQTASLKEKVVLLLIVSVIAVVIGQSFENTLCEVLPEEYVFRSVVNKKASGLSGLYAIAERSGLPCKLWLWPYRRLKEVHGLLFVVTPLSQWTGADTKAILDWVSQGNKLVYFDSFLNEYDPLRAKYEHGHKWKKENVLSNRELLKKWGLKSAWAENAVPIYNYDLPEMSHVYNLIFNSKVKIMGGQPLVSCNGGMYITSINYGLGKILIGTVPELCANQALSSNTNYDNFQFMVNCLRTTNGTVFFDEYCHHIQDQGNVFVYFSRQLPGLICLQLLIIFAFAEWSTLNRFGPLKSIRNARSISDLVYVEGLANVYKRAQANLAALEIIVGFWRAKLCRYLGLPTSGSTAEIVQRAKDVEAPEQMLQFFNDYEQTVASGQVTKTAFIKLVKECDQFHIDSR